MARRSLRPHLNQIRGWVRQGRTDAWIAHQLEATVQQIEAFKKEHDLLPDGDEPKAGATDFDDEIDLRAEDDAQIAAELEAAEAARAEEEARRAGGEGGRAGGGGRGGGGGGGGRRRGARRRRRGGPPRRRSAATRRPPRRRSASVVAAVAAGRAASARR